MRAARYGAADGARGIRKTGAPLLDDAAGQVAAQRIADVVLRRARAAPRKDAVALDDRDGVHVQALEKKLRNAIGRVGR